MNAFESASAILEVSDLRKRFVTRARTVDALRGVSFSIYPGEIFGLLGPNGSGKSTSINIIADLLEADSGTVTLDGKSPGTRGYGDSAAFVSGDAQFLWVNTGAQILDFYRRVYNAPKEAVEVLTKRFGLSHRLDREWPQYSNGEKMRVRLVRALLARPRLLVLDEPTVGLDPEAALDFRTCMKELQAAGTTILLTSHYMAEVEALADRICFIHQGKVEAIGTPETFRAPKETVEIEFDAPPVSLPKEAEILSERIVKVPLSALDKTINCGEIRRIRTQEESLEDYFVSLARDAT